MIYYDVGVLRLKLGEDDVPSEETTSEVDALLLPPSRITSPDSRPQHMWASLRPSRLTGSASKFFPSNFSQDLSDDAPRPPQRKLLQKVDPVLISLVFPTGNV